MKRSASIISFVIYTITFFSCDNENALDCFKKPGEIIEQEIQLNSFKSIEAYDEMDIYLVNSNEQKVIIKAGKNLISKIHLSVENDILTISNDNTCNWVRSPENPGIYIFSNDISGIGIFDYANIISEEPLKLDNLSIFSDGTGNFEMNIDIDSLFVKSIYISNFNFTGNAGFIDLLLTGDSRFLAGNLLAGDIKIDHNGSNRVELHPINSLKGVIQSTGSVYYYHEPIILDVTVRGAGRLINLSE
jgi:hypothetical protein